VWTLNNIGVTLLNKAAFATVDFHYPYALSAIHMFCNALGSQFVLKTTSQNNANNANNSATTTAKSKQPLDASGRRRILAFSLLFSLNIAIGNVSLQHVSVNFNQVMRSLVPALTMAMGLALGKPIAKARQWAVLPIVIGVAMACLGEMTFSAIGFVYTVACVVLAALKVVASGELLTNVPPVELLGYMAPLAFVQCVFLSVVTGESQVMMEQWRTQLKPMSYIMLVVWMSGALSFSLNICSLQANKLTSPLTLCIAANVKQVLMMVISTILFHVQVSPLNAAGIVVVLVGSARYSYVSVMEQSAKKSRRTQEPDEEEVVELIASSKEGGGGGGESSVVQQRHNKH
jgi:drug/metabolite transporter (DMT)-like permease